MKPCPSQGNRNTPARILYLQSTSKIGGTTTSLLGIIRKLDHTRFVPHVVAPSVSPLLKKLEMQGCRLFILKEMLRLSRRKGKFYYLRYLMNYPRVIGKILEIIRREQIDLVHTNDLHNLYGFLAAKLSRRPHIWHVREIVVQSRAFGWLELFLVRHFATRILVTSDAVAAMFANRKGAYPAHLRKIPNGVDLTLYHPSNQGSRIFADLAIPPSVPLIGVVGRLDHWKGVDTFLQAAALCREQFPQVQYLVVGGAIEGREEYAEKIIELADKLHLRDVVHFTGWRYGPEDMPEMHAALRVMVLGSSWPEPFGNVLLEAMATGKPVVATNHGGPREICVDGETGILVAPRNPEKMAEAIRALLQDPARARAMGAAGRKRVEKFYDLIQCVRKIEAVYQEALVQAGRANLTVDSML